MFSTLQSFMAQRGICINTSHQQHSPHCQPDSNDHQSSHQYVALVPFVQASSLFNELQSILFYIQFLLEVHENFIQQYSQQCHKKIVDPTNMKQAVMHASILLPPLHFMNTVCDDTTTTEQDTLTLWQRKRLQALQHFKVALAAQIKHTEYNVSPITVSSLGI